MALNTVRCSRASNSGRDPLTVSQKSRIQYKDYHYCKYARDLEQNNAWKVQEAEQCKEIPLPELQSWFLGDGRALPGEGGAAW